MAIYLGIDQATLVLLIKVEDISRWEYTAMESIKFVECKLNIISILGFPSGQAVKPPQGYTKAFQYGIHDFYFAIAFHDMKPDMGIVIKFSAKAFEYYRQKYFDVYEEKINLHNLIQWLSSDLYKVRCSRIDLYADYIDENIDITELYNNLQRGTYGIRHGNGRLNISKQSAVISGDKVETIYIGAKRQKNNRILLRIYNKREEQLKNPFAFKSETAASCKNWIRFEVECKQSYAHLLTALLMKIHTEQELINLIASSITDKYQFFDTENERVLFFTQMLIENISEPLKLSLPKVEKNNEIQKSIDYICMGSGLFPLLYKIEKIWGIKGVEEFNILLKDRYKEYEPNDEVVRWIKQNYLDLSNLPFPYS